MQRRSEQKGFILPTPVLVVSVLLIVQAAVLYGFSRKEIIPDHTPLASLGPFLGEWQQIRDSPIDQETMDVLKADDTLSRSYATPSRPYPVNLFIAFFKSQRTGVAPHSPKNCMPGTGWTPVLSEVTRIDVPGRSEPIEANRFIVAKGEARILVFYWYQSRDRTVASEYKAKYFVAVDAMRNNRTDTSLIRVEVPLAPGDQKNGEETLINFIRAMYGPVRQHLPA